MSFPVPSCTFFQVGCVYEKGGQNFPGVSAQWFWPQVGRIVVVFLLLCFGWFGGCGWVFLKFSLLLRWWVWSLSLCFGLSHAYGFPLFCCWYCCCLHCFGGVGHYYIYVHFWCFPPLVSFWWFTFLTCLLINFLRWFLSWTVSLPRLRRVWWHLWVLMLLVLLLTLPLLFLLRWRLLWRLVWMI